MHIAVRFPQIPLLRIIDARMMAEYPFLSSLDDSDLIRLYGEVSLELRNRGCLATCQKSIRRLLARASAADARLPDQYGKLKLATNQSILLDLLDDDWSSLFAEYAKSDRSDYYVYYHTDYTKPKSRYSNGDRSVEFCGRPFYIGKGVGGRYKSMRRSTSHIKRVKGLLPDGAPLDSVCKIFKDGLTEIEAFELESKLIAFFGCAGEVPAKCHYFHGSRGGFLINADTPPRPEYVDRLIEKLTTKK